MLLKERVMVEKHTPLPKTNPDPAEHKPEEMVDESIEESFPASDPPSWTLGISPRERPEPSDGCIE